MEDFIMLRTKNNIYNLDYYLTQHDKKINRLPNDIILKPYIRKNVDFKFKNTVKNYTFLTKIGGGGFSSVFLVRKKDDGMIYAMKIVNKKPIIKINKEQYLFREKDIWKELDNKFISRLYYVFQSNTYIFFVSEYASGGELYYHIRQKKGFNEEHIILYITEQVLAINYLHKKNIVYRDIKPENVMLDIDGHIKLVDFGLSKNQTNEENKITHSFCGSEDYLSPEMIQRVGHNYLVDIYAVGILTYELQAGFSPFQIYKKNSDDSVKEFILTKEINFPSKFSDLVKSFIKYCIAKEPSKRLGSLGGIQDCFRHKWMSGVDKNLVNEKKITPPFIPRLNTLNFHQKPSELATVYRKLKDDYSSGIDPEYKLFKFEYDWNDKNVDHLKNSSFISMTQSSTSLGGTRNSTKKSDYYRFSENQVISEQKNDMDDDDDVGEEPVNKLKIGHTKQVITLGEQNNMYEKKNPKDRNTYGYTRKIFEKDPEEKGYFRHTK